MASGTDTPLNRNIIWPTGLPGAKPGFVTLTISALFFYFSGCLVDRFLPKIAEKQRWKWKNISVSLINALITGVWSVLCFVEEPAMTEDMILTHTALGHTLISAVVGYFVYDTVDMLVYQRTRQTVEVLLHHVVVIFCFGIVFLVKQYVGYAVVALFVEINGVFLHTRKLLQMCGFTKTNHIYRLNSLINLGTFLVFRILTLAWMTRWIVINKDLVPFAFYCVITVGVAIMTVINIILFYRLLCSDFLYKSKDRDSSTVHTKNE